MNRDPFGFSFLWCFAGKDAWSQKFSSELRTTRLVHVPSEKF